MADLACRSSTVGHGHGSVNGYRYATKGTRYDYGELTMDAGKSIREAPVENLGPTFTGEVPRHGITAIVIPKAP